MQKYDVWFVPNREKNPNAVDRHDESWRGLSRESAIRVAFQLNTHMDDPDSGVFKVKAASTWPRPGFSWWAGSNEERYTEGPYPTKEQAFLAGLSNDWPQVWVTEAKMGELKIPDMADWILERLEDHNEELGDPDGDGLFAKVGGDKLKLLDLSLRHTVHEWMKANDVEPRIWAFGETALTEATGITLHGYLMIAVEFSFLTFGPGRRSAGVIDHITKELVEVESDDKEWVDVAILALDGCWRAYLQSETDTPIYPLMADAIVGDVDWWLVRPQRTFDEMWTIVRNHPLDPKAWAGLHVAAMRQSVHLHCSHLDTKDLAYNELFAKIIINKLRVWPDWRTAERGKAIEHDRTGE